MSARRIRFNRTLFSIPMNGHAPIRMVAHLAAEDIELILDIRQTAEAEQQFGLLCEEAAIYYIHKPDLSGNTWAVGLSLRHRTCIIGDDHDHRVALSEAIAEQAGQRVIDLETSPAPIAMPND
jgi:hypothetical protein